MIAKRKQLNRVFIVLIAAASATWNPSEEWWKSTAIRAIEQYQRNLSGRLPGICCRYEESCSNYCKRCIEQHGPVYGAYLGCCRLASCW
jgi:putative component of membrane protein insertase Oxa1/YidC/SpoIIIJ protein YidD